MEREKNKEIMNKNANLMTQATKERLELEHKNIKAKILEVGESIGEAAGLNSDWHDNPAFDYAQAEFKTLGVQEAQLEEKLRHVEIIEPRQKTDSVNVGNTVIVRFLGLDENESFTILGEDDGITGREYTPRWINNKTPLAQALIGSKNGDVVRVNEISEVKVIEILPGQFKNGEA